MKKIGFMVLWMMLSGLSDAMGAAQEIKMAILAPEGTTWMNIMNQFNAELEKETKGAVKFKIYAGGVLGDEIDVVRKMRIGQVHAGGFTGVGLGQIVPAVRVLELPFLFNNESEIDAVTSQLKSYYEAEFEKKGFVFLGWAEAGFVNVYANKPVTTLEDLKKIKMWAWEGDPLVKALASAYGVVPVSLAITDVLTSLQTRLIDSFYAPPLAAIALQWFTKVKYMTEPYLANATGALIMTKSQFKKLSLEVQGVVKKVSEKYSKIIIAATRKDNQSSYAVLQKHGIQFVKAPDAEVQKLKEVSVKVQKALVGKLYDQALLDRVLSIVESHRKKMSSAKISK
ncbi:MAG: TRAP transporter substrate-binding protein DctP [Deltaproteobacteria bacterium]|nr:TRAP transporter substrate-binding protein DctP [Deltaproteobacteria bacterium]